MQHRPLFPAFAGASFLLEPVGPEAGLAVNSTITAVAGLQAGHFTDAVNGTGCSVFLCREGAVGGVDVRGGSPGTRETDLLRPLHRVEKVHAITLSGGSAFGLEAASGVMSWLAEQGIGLRVGPGIIPIVASAILFDLGLLNPQAHPGLAEGRAACLAADDKPLDQGSVGAGTGATVGKALGLEHAVKSGIGSASLRLPSGVTVAAAVAVNAIGGVVDFQSGEILAGPRREGKPGFHDRFYDSVDLLLREKLTPGSPALSNTTIGVVATDAPLTKEQANFLAQVSHDGLALAIRPCHTLRDGDTMFAMATGTRSEPTDITILCAAAVQVTAQSVINAVKFATGLGGLPAISEL